MRASWSDWCRRLALASALTMGGMLASSGHYAWSQIQSDNTLGTQSSIVTSPNLINFQIDGGATRGTTLFHSFREFSVPTGGSVYFNNTVNIENILTRVTGASISNIDGLVQANGTANLLVINPNGIIFGLNASLNIGGSFLASTASSLIFSDGTEFSATAPQNTPLLTVSVPVGLQFGGNSGSIRNQSQATNSSGKPVGLTVEPGKTLALVGSEVTLSGGRLTTAGGRIELGSVAGPSLVSLNPTDNGWALGYDSVQNFQDIQLSQRAVVDASGEGGGDIQVHGRRVTVTDGSQIVSKTLGSGLRGSLTVTASESVEVSGESANPQDYSRLTTRTEGAGDAGNLTINTGRFIVEAGAQVSAGTLSTGQGGTLTINASDLVQVSGASADGEVLSRLTTRAEGAGDAGNLTINTGRFIVEAGGQVSSGTLQRSRGDGGTLTVNASESVRVSGASADGEVLSRLTTRTEGDGDAGDLTINTRRFIVEAGAQVSAGTLPSSTGDGGTLTVTASDLVQVSGASPLAVSDGEHLSRLTSRTQGAGDAGDLTITTGKLVIENGAQVSAGTSGFNTGNGGSLTVTASDLVQVSEASPDGEDVSRLTARTESGGDARNLTITTRRLVIENGAQVSAGTFGEGRGGTLNVTASDSVQVSGFAIDPGGNKVASRIATRTQGGGDAQALTITTGSLIIRDEAEVDVRSFNPNSGTAGNLEITARSIQLDNQGKLIAETASGDGGNIILRDLDLLLMRGNSQITTTAGTAKAGGDGGNIEIYTDFIVAVPSENSDIRANAYTGKGGRVDITAQSIFGLQFRQADTLHSSDITASSEFGVQGTVTLNIPDVDPSRGLTNLPTEVVDASDQIAQNCRTGGAAASEQSSFVVTGRGGLPPNPKEPLSKDAVQVDWVALNPEEENRSEPIVSTNPTNTTPAPLVEAQGWLINPKGQVVLTATAPTVTPYSSWRSPTSCRAPQSEAKVGT